MAGRAMRFWEDTRALHRRRGDRDRQAGRALPCIPARARRESLEDYLHHLRFGFQAAAAAGPPARPRHVRLPAARAQPEGAQALPARVRGRSWSRKTYVAVLDGVPEAESRDRRHGARQDLDRRGGLADGAGRRRQDGGDPLARRRGEGRARGVVFTPETGRTHQIRVHAASGIGIPISGDPVYGAGRGPMLLHALSI